MIVLAPIPENIQNTLNQKIEMLRGGNIWPSGQIVDNSAPVTDGEQGIAKNYMFARSPWLRMTSFVPKNYAAVEAAADPESNAVERGIVNQNVGWNPVILMGGEENDYGRIRAGFGDRKAGMGIKKLETDDFNSFLQYSGLYTTPAGPASINMPFRPKPGVKDISIGYKGGGMKLGATRSGEINWTCWTWEELERLTPHFLAPGKTVLLEWGWTGVGALRNVNLLEIFKNDDNLTKSFDPKKIENLNTKITKHIQDQDGHYDAILGLIQNFSWSVNEYGGFDCITNLISPGVTLMQTKGKSEKWKNFDSLPLLKEQSSHAEDAEGKVGTIPVEEAKTNQLKELSKISPYITFRDYMSDFSSQIFHTFNHTGFPVKNGEKIKKLQADIVKLLAYLPLPKTKAAAKKLAEIEKLSAESEGIATTSDGLEINAKTGGIDNFNFPAFQVDRFKLPTLSASDNVNVTEAGGISFETYMHKVSRVGAYHFVTWGWFEDNVLSRFFGKIGDAPKPRENPAVDKRVISEFRSIEQDVDPADGRVLIDKDGDPVVQSTRFRNSRYLVTLDTAKWIIPNIGDPFWSFVEKSRPNVHIDGPNWTWVQDTFLPYKLEKDVKVHDDVDHMGIRNIIFNVEYLSKMSKKGNDVKSAVLSIWDDFAREYGGVYKFKIEFDDDTKRMMVKEEGYTQVRVALLLKNKNKTASDNLKVPLYPNVYEFPIMEDGSIVKSQTINAKLPQRMQVSAMYGSRGGLKDPDEEKQKREQLMYDDYVGLTWGKMASSIDINEEDPDAEDNRQKNLNDLLTGDMDFPSRLNREFGNMTADITRKLYIGDAGTFTDEDGFSTIPTLDTTMGGTKIQPSILQDINDQQKIYIQEKKKIDFDKAKKLTGKELTISDIVRETELFAEGFAAFDSMKKRNAGAANSELYCYEAGQLEEWSQGKEKVVEKTRDAAGVESTNVTPGDGYLGAIEGYTEDVGLIGEDDWTLERVYMQTLTNQMTKGTKEEPTSFEPKAGLQTGFLTFKHTLRHSLIKLLRADRYGVLANIDPLLPIDFEMVIDGTGGMFPGNSFHSSYLGDAYRKQSVFQMVGVDHTIDSSGWFTTIKGQIRCTSELLPVGELNKEQQDERDNYDKEAQKKAIAASAKFVEWQKERLDLIAQERADALAATSLQGNYIGQIERYTGVNPAKTYGHRPVDRAARKIHWAIRGAGTNETDVYDALKTTFGYIKCQEALVDAFAKFAGDQRYSNTSLLSWLDGDFDNGSDYDEYTHVAILAGFKYKQYSGKGWGEPTNTKGVAQNNADNAPPNSGKWIGNLKNKRQGDRTSSKKANKFNGKYYIND